MEWWNNGWRGLPRSPNIPVFQNSRFFQEVRATVDEMDHNDKPKRGKVLRATDVIPPFDKDARPPEDGVEIPSYDLAENILAEQRRAAGRRRRGPGEAGGQKTADRRRTTDATRGATVSSATATNLLELQRVVAEIVARDIERLCRKPDRSGTLPEFCCTSGRPRVN